MRLKRLALSLLAIAALGAGFAGVADARDVHAFAIAQRYYNPATTTTVTGTIAEVVSPVPAQGGLGVHLTLNTAQGPVDVRLGPAWYVNALNLNLKAGDTVTVTGSRVPGQATPVIIAATITKNGQTATLRDQQGVPAWSGRGQGRP